MSKLKAFRLSDMLAERIEGLAKRTHRTEKYYVEQALTQFFAEYEDALIAKERFEDPAMKIVSAKEMRARLGV